MSYKVPFIKPDFPPADELVADYLEIIKANWYTNFGPFERKFAQKLGEYIGPGYYAATFANATVALQAAILSTLGKGDGSKYVIMPSFTFPAGGDVLIWCGYKPLFVDIVKPGLHMDVTVTKKALKDKAYGPNIVGILFCNAFGVGSLDIVEWEKLSEATGLPLIIDSAAGFGSLYDQKRKVGSAGTCEIFSFHATKPFAIGEGGAVISRDKQLIDDLMSIQNFGFNQQKKIDQLGFNGKLQEINAAIGLRQFKRFDTILKDRRAIFERYQAKLDPDKFELQANASNASLCFAAVLVKDGSKRDDYLANLQAAGVDAKTYYAPTLHKQMYFKDTAHYSSLYITDEVDASILSLPIHDSMEPDDIELIINTLNE